MQERLVTSQIKGKNKLETTVITNLCLVMANEVLFIIV